MYNIRFYIPIAVISINIIYSCGHFKSLSHLRKLFAEVLIIGTELRLSFSISE